MTVTVSTAPWVTWREDDDRTPNLALQRAAAEPRRFRHVGTWLPKWPKP